MRIWLYAVAIILLIFGASDLRAAEPPRTLPNGLARVDDANVKLAHVRPGID
jgi:hypothetical protein